MSPRQGGCPGAIPGNRTNSIKSRTSLCGRVSKTQPAWGSTRATCQYIWGRGRRVMHLPCKQTQAGALPAASTNSNRGENEIQASLINSASAGATPAPATTACAGPPREVIRLPDCKSGVAKQSRKRRTGALPALPTISGSVAQSAERPVVCGRVEGAIPFGSAIFSECGSVFRAPGLGPGGRR
jgi:hypothetical protein